MIVDQNETQVVGTGFNGRLIVVVSGDTNIDGTVIRETDGDTLIVSPNGIFCGGVTLSAGQTASVSAKGNVFLTTADSFEIEEDDLTNSFSLDNLKSGDFFGSIESLTFSVSPGKIEIENCGILANETENNFVFVANEVEFVNTGRPSVPPTSPDLPELSVGVIGLVAENHAVTFAVVGSGEIEFDDDEVELPSTLGDFNAITFGPQFFVKSLDIVANSASFDMTPVITNFDNPSPLGINIYLDGDLSLSNSVLATNQFVASEFDGASIFVQAENITLTENSSFLTSPFVFGSVVNSGSISVLAESFSLSQFSSLSTANFLPGANAGAIKVEAETVHFGPGAFLDANKFDTGNAGNITFEGDDFTFDGDSIASEISSQGFNGGTPGEIKIEAEDRFSAIGDADVLATSPQGGGKINIESDSVSGIAVSTSRTSGSDAIAGIVIGIP